MELGTSSKVDDQNVGMPSKDRSRRNKSLADRGQIKMGKVEIEASLLMWRNMAVCDVEDDEIDLVQNDQADVKNFRNRNSKKKRNNCKGRIISKKCESPKRVDVSGSRVKRTPQDCSEAVIAMVMIFKKGRRLQSLWSKDLIPTLVQMVEKRRMKY